MNNRNAIIDIEKFIASIAIMTLHTYLFIHNDESLLFYDGWIFVEFFLLITGYYTASHFAKLKSDNRARSSFIYYLRKFVPLLPYTIMATVVQWLMFGAIQIQKGLWEVKDLVSAFLNVVLFEGVLIQSTEISQETFVATYWYLISLIMVFPLFMLVTNISNNYLKLLIGFVYSLGFYSIIGIGSICRLPVSLFRVLAGLMVGLVIYEITEIFELCDRIKNKKSMTIVALLIFAVVICATLKNLGLNRFYLVGFIINLSILISTNVTPSIGKGVCSYLGRLSMPIYLLHYTVGTIVDMVVKTNRLMTTIVLYCVSSIVIAAIVMGIMDRSKPFDQWLKSLNDLK